MAAAAASPAPAQPAEVTLDPKLKQSLLTLIMEELYEPVQAKQARLLDEIIVRNARWSKTYYLSYDGVTYRHSSISPKVRLTLPIPRLDASLRPEMKAWLETQRRLEQEQIFTGGAIAAIFVASNHYEDWLRLLPECIRGGVETYLAGTQMPTHYPRMSEEEVQAFLNKQAPYLLKIRERMVLNLIQS